MPAVICIGFGKRVGPREILAFGNEAQCLVQDGISVLVFKLIHGDWNFIVRDGSSSERNTFVHDGVEYRFYKRNAYYYLRIGQVELREIHCVKEVVGRAGFTSDCHSAMAPDDKRGKQSCRRD